MIPAQFDYVRPGNLDETLAILKDREGEAKLLSGGYSLIPLIKLRLAQPALLVDLRDVTGLDGIVETDDYLRIGARATHRQIHEADVVRDSYPLLHDVSATIGDPQVRNWGTIGGSVAHADPASDWPAALIAGNATIVCRSQSGEREIASRDFFLDTFQTAIEPTEVLTEIRVVRRPRASAGAYEKLERKVGDFATVGVAAIVWLDDAGHIKRAGIGLTGVAETPFAATDAEAVLRRQPTDRRPVPRGGCSRRRAEPTLRRRARPGRIQAGDGRRDDPQGSPPRHRTRPRVRVGGRTMTTQHITVTVNGEAHEADVEPRLLLVHFLRDDLGLTGTHVGCDTSNCGACTSTSMARARSRARCSRSRRTAASSRPSRGWPASRRSTRSSRRSGISTASNAASARRG